MNDCGSGEVDVARESEGMTREQEEFLCYLDRDMAEEDRVRFEARLAEDPELAGRLQAYRRTVELLRSMGPASAPLTVLRGAQHRLAARFPKNQYLRFPYELVVFTVLMIGVIYAYVIMLESPGVESAQMLRLELKEFPDRALAREFGLSMVPPTRQTPALLSVRLDAARARALLERFRPLLSDPPATLNADAKAYEIRLIFPKLE